MTLARFFMFTSATFSREIIEKNKGKNQSMICMNGYFQLSKFLQLGIYLHDDFVNNMNNAIAALHIGTNNSGLEIFPFNYGVSAAIYFVHFFYKFESGGSTEHCYRTFFGHFDQLGSGQTFPNLQVTFQNCLSLKWEK